MKPEEVEPYWTKQASKLLLGRKIVRVRYLTEEERNELDWYAKCVVIELDDRTLLYPSRDDEGTDAGALFSTDENVHVLPVI